MLALHLPLITSKTNNSITEDEKHWELHSIDENSAKLFTNGEYPLAALKTIVENILFRQIKDPDITVNISQVKEDLLVIMTMKEKWVERKITLQFDSKKRATEIERLETLLYKTRRELPELKSNHVQQILQLKQEIESLKTFVDQTVNNNSITNINVQNCDITDYKTGFVIKKECINKFNALKRNSYRYIIFKIENKEELHVEFEGHISA
jgi:hypothetical protein